MRKYQFCLNYYVVLKIYLVRYFPRISLEVHTPTPEKESYHYVSSKFSLTERRACKFSRNYTPQCVKFDCWCTIDCLLIQY